MTAATGCYIQRVPESKHQKNHLHLDLRTAEMEGEVLRIRGLGATLITDHALLEDDSRWHILADPAGNEFCVLQPSGQC